MEFRGFCGEFWMKALSTRQFGTFLSEKYQSHVIKDSGWYKVMNLIISSFSFFQFLKHHRWCIVNLKFGHLSFQYSSNLFLIYMFIFRHYHRNKVRNRLVVSNLQCGFNVLSFVQIRIFGWGAIAYLHLFFYIYMLLLRREYFVKKTRGHWLFRGCYNLRFDGCKP